MPKIDLRKFVDINIQKHVDAVIKGTRDTTVLFTSYGAKGTVNVVSNIEAVNALYKGKASTDNLIAYATIYFNHSGCKLAIYEGYATVTKDDLTNLPDEYICVASVDSTYSQLEELANQMNDDSTIYGVKEKIIFARNAVITDATSVKNFAVKYSEVTGAEMTMAAYLSKIDTHAVDTVYDYAFTQEKIAASNIDNAQFDTLMTNNYNVDVYLANATRVCGGNCKDGADLTNNFVRIVLHQTLTDTLIQLLTTKLKSNDGLGKIYTAIAREMSYYLNCGYLTTDKIWTDDTLTIVRNDRAYTIIEQGTALINGYTVTILPMSSLTDDEKAQHKAPLIYLIIADQYGIRKITINGEVI